MSSDEEHAAPLGALVKDLREARAQVRIRRDCRPGRVSLDAFADAQRDLWIALEAYVGALEAHDLPVPRRVRSELQMHRVLYGDQR